MAGATCPGPQPLSQYPEASLTFFPVATRRILGTTYCHERERVELHIGKQQSSKAMALRPFVAVLSVYLSHCHPGTWDGKVIMRPDCRFIRSGAFEKVLGFQLLLPFA